MHNVSVVFLDNDDKSPDAPKYRAVVDHEVLITHPQERINWEFHAGGMDIKYVGIDFRGKPDAKFFADSDLDQANHPGNQPVSVCNFITEVVQGRAVIYGTPPSYGSGQEDKYSIFAYNGTGEILAKLDPKIVTAIP